MAYMYLGQDPELPEWYERLKGAQAVNIPPWVADGHPYNCQDIPTIEFWMRCALIKERAENEAQGFIQDNAESLGIGSSKAGFGDKELYGYSNAEREAAEQKGQWLKGTPVESHADMR